MSFLVVVPFRLSNLITSEAATAIILANQKQSRAGSSALQEHEKVATGMEVMTL